LTKQQLVQKTVIVIAAVLSFWLGGAFDVQAEDGNLPQSLTCEQECLGECEVLSADGKTCITPGSEFANCCKCSCGNPDCSTATATGTNNVWTEVGCLTTTQEGIIAAVLRIFIGIATGLAVIRFVQAGIMFNTDDMEKIKEAKEIASSAIVALILGGITPVLINWVLGMDVLGLGSIFG